MGRFLEFAEVLEDKIRKEIRSKDGYFPSENDLTASKSENLVIDNSPLGLAWLLGELERKAPISNKGKTAYGVTMRPPRPRKSHVLMPEQQLAFEFFKTDSPDLQPGFTLRELKSAFRKSALIHHPDRGGAVAQFLILTKSYEALSSLFEA